MSDGEGGETAFLLREMRQRLDNLEAHVTAIQRQVDINTTILQQGVTGGAQAHFQEIKESIGALRTVVSQLETKTNRWEGGGTTLYSLLVAAGGAIGWFLSHLMPGVNK